MMNKSSYFLIAIFVILAGVAVYLFLIKEMDWRALSLICVSAVLGILAQLWKVKKITKEKPVV